MESRSSNYEFRRPIQGLDSNYGTPYKDYKNRWTVYEDIQQLEAQDISDDMIREYYNGLPCQLGYVLAGKTVERETVGLIMEEILGHNAISHLAILDAGGEGKTTALMQLVVRLIQSGKRVYFSQDAPELHIEYISFNENDIIIVDNANHVKNFYDFLSLSTKKGVRVIFAARANEWEMQKINIDINRSIKEYKLSGFSDREKHEFAKQLSRFTDMSEAEIYEIFDNKSNQFLLAAMLRTMNGGINLEKIVEDIINETKENLKDGYKEYALAILTIICLVEQAGSKMPIFLLRNICNSIDEDATINHKDLVNIYLKKEVQATSTFVETRHPRICELFFKNLIRFNDIDLAYEVFSRAKDNIKNTRTDKVSDYLDIVGKVTNYIYANYPELLALIDDTIEVNIDTFYLQYAIQCKTLFKIWIDIKMDSIKDMSGDQYIIDDLYSKATSKWFIMGNSEMWYKWAKYKTELGNIGNVDEPNSAIWIYHQALLNNQVDEAVLIGWADLAAKLDNYGDALKPEPYSARWIYRWSVDNQKLTENMIYNWAQLEESLDNCGHIRVEYSARWIYNLGITNKSANENLLIKWADMEMAKGNIGEAIAMEEAKVANTSLETDELEEAKIEPHSALWIYQWGFKNKKAAENLLIKWADLEIKCRGLGDVNTKYSARWIFEWGRSNNKADENLYLKWAEAELEADRESAVNLEKPYNARWIYSQGLRAGKANANLIYRWIQLEFELGNIEPANEEYTVLWLLNYIRQIRLDDRNYWYWLIGCDMALGNIDQAYTHCKEALLTHDIYEIFALVQGERGVRDDVDEGMEHLLNMTLQKSTLLGLYCSYLCDIIYRDGQQAQEYLDRFNDFTNDLSYFTNKAYLKFWMQRLDS